MKRLFETLVMPPVSLYLAVACGLLLRALAKRPWLRRTGLALSAAGAGTVVLLSIPQVAFWLLDGLQTSPAIAPAATTIEADAIVVLAADADCDPPEYGPDQPGALSLARCRYGAALARRTGLPLLITGGVLRPDRRAISLVLEEFVEEELGVPVRWTEERSHTTRQNAFFSAKILRESGIQRVAVVTHAWHMPRALDVFRETGLELLPAPTCAHTPPERWWKGWVPRSRSLRDSTWAIHEYVGRLWYRISG